MNTLINSVRTVALALLSGGSASIVFAAIVLVNAAKAHGVPVPEAAANNAPVFIQFGKVALVAAVLLAMSEFILFAKNLERTKLDFWRLAVSALCVLLVLVFSLGIVPQMDLLLPQIKDLPEAHEKFTHLHELSRAIFGSSILLAFVSLLLPGGRKESRSQQSREESKVHA